MEPLSYTIIPSLFAWGKRLDFWVLHIKHGSSFTTLQDYDDNGAAWAGDVILSFELLFHRQRDLIRIHNYWGRE